jgi:hypothetical protein
MFKRKYKEKKAYVPNRCCNTPIMAFRANMKPEILLHVQNLKKDKQANKFINEAIQNHYLYAKDPEKFFKQIIENNFYFMRRLVRKVGRERCQKNVQPATAQD